MLLVVTALMLSTNIKAQSQDIYTQLSTADPATRNTVQLNEHSSIRNLAMPTTTNNNIRGYRVRIFFDNSQSARTTAQEIKEEFEKMYPLVPCYLIYENPYFKVTVGNCLSNEEAIMLWNRIKGSFDHAFVIREEIPFEELRTPAVRQMEPRFNLDSTTFNSPTL